jgi:hypothetical protein
VAVIPHCEWHLALNYVENRSAPDHNRHSISIQPLSTAKCSPFRLFGSLPNVALIDSKGSDVLVSRPGQGRLVLKHCIEQLHASWP